VSFDELRRREYGRLDDEGHAYLDYTGSGLYGASQLRAQWSRLSAGVFGNPHSENPTSAASTGACERARRRILEFFHADPEEYDVCFTANASGALKLIGESYPFEPGVRFVMTADNHNSVNGIGRYAEAAGATVEYVPLGPDLRVASLEPYLSPVTEGRPALFAFPAQSNFSGVKHPLEWVDLARSRGYDVVLDSAAFVPTNPLRLDRVRPDFACVSFYKMFGFPTGVGALLARRAVVGRLRRPWFAGGTVEFVSTQHRMHQLKHGHEAFEDGTVNFLDIAAVPDGLDLLESVGMAEVQTHVQRLTEVLLRGLSLLRHGNGRPVVELYGPTDARERGGTVAFNVRDREGELVRFSLVELAAAHARVSVRGGCFCNPGAAEAAFGFPPEGSRNCLQTLSAGFSIERFADCLPGVPVGAVRASVGIASNEQDVARLLEVLAAFRDTVAEEEPTAAVTSPMFERGA
jgi:selenocysteine lyase/cysteine desulfurase